ncbi:bifunctional DNA primase/polymerase [Allokutzneria albata]|uniref:Bifunctional DNA primase/polymerase, N-terminal n=1 Tax=Allokutzneria albata TaxID=211114 RepID=A0A1H0AJK2_ALLAB|nr:bifunctional DNA primase/polymerase [Allokutzneria albata]SDN33504.1 Bifunctional DNA primase/polymerase, N-terminal [Allokutzneria albata]
MDWSDSWRGAFRIELRAEAIGLAWRGWPVLPGTYPTAAGWAGRDGIQTDGPVPVHQDWAERVGTQPDQVATWWSGRPYSLLVATGIVLDAIEVDAELGRRAAIELRAAGVVVPIAATPSGSWLFLTGTGAQLRRELAVQGGIVLHGKDSYIPLPPSPFQHGVAHWRVKPQVCGWNLPSSEIVQDALSLALRSDAVDNAARLVTAER